MKVKIVVMVIENKTARANPTNPYRSPKNTIRIKIEPICTNEV